ncbi:uncharacterized protein SPSK_01428 [Sporothrix schenckii 1099-18]|uniref:DUF2293 domain-containing protein n=1 Tax=Sporothrix schenckii 1099-18 TaxID=1397361 RepID=A0A0F2MD20_SPOSC|nr:uncharacterized protein SPSK_01428 [Sporothrix schenckii 1099-18]KJR86959.1 hypothetical protein SPSK_01428 [Sporothrix schenckii 1099-18]
MGREKKHSGPGAAPGAHAKERHKKRLRAQTISNPVVLNARPEVHNLKSKHHSYYEIVENKDKKKKLEFKITSRRTPPPGFEFVPIGNPELTKACKELSREHDAMIFIVSNGTGGGLSQQMNRVGHHIRQGIVEEARREVSDNGNSSDDHAQSGLPEPIPESQEEINAQADLAIRDLFPRIPNTDRQTIIEHSFKKGATKKGEPLVGLARDIPLSRRVQLAVLAHIRHTHTRYDSLLRETSYLNARKAVEGLCLDVLVKWRGDEETGRDQLDEILREVIVISDSEGEEDGDEDEDDEADSSGVESGDLAAEPSYLPYPAVPQPRTRKDPETALELRHTRRPLVYGERATWRDEPDYSYARPTRPYMQDLTAAHRARRGFKRYEAALSARWGEAVHRARHQQDHPKEAPPRIVEYRSHSQQGILRPEQAPASNHVYYTSTIRDSPQLRGGDGSTLQPLEYPTRGPIQTLVASDTALQRSPSGGLSRGASPLTDPRQTQQPQRVVVRSSEARDFLVPSVEPLSPSMEQLPTAPVFVRTVSPRQVSRPPKGRVDDRRTQYDSRNSPGWGGEPGTLKRRRVVDDESYSPHGAPLHAAVPMRRLASDGWKRAPAYYAVSRPHEAPPHIPTDQDSHTHVALRQTHRVTRIPVSAPEGRPYYESPGLELPLGSERAPIVLDDSDMDRPLAAATYPVRDYRGNIISEHREQPYQDVEVQHAPFVEYRRPPLTDYSGRPNPEGPPIYIESMPRPQDPLPIHLGPSAIDRPVVYERQPPPHNAPEPRPVVYNPPLPPIYDSAPSHLHHQDVHEPAPMFIRPVVRHSPRPLAEVQGQPQWHHNSGATHDYQAHPPAAGAWAQPPQASAYDAPAAYQLYPPHPAQHPLSSYDYGSHAEHHNQHYNQPGQ